MSRSEKTIMQIDLIKALATELDLVVRRIGSLVTIKDGDRTISVRGLQQAINKLYEIKRKRK